MKRPTVRQVGEAGVFVARSRPAIGCAGVIALVILLLAGSCYTRQRGVLEERVRQYQSQANAYRKSAEAFHAQADAEKKRGDSLAKRADQKTTVYRTLRDSLVLTDTVVVKEAFAAADDALEAKDSVIASQSRRIGFLEATISEKDLHIGALNRVIATQTGAIKSARRGGVVKGIKIGAAVGAAAVWVLK